MTRNRIVALVAVLASLAVTSVAMAAKVTGGTTALTLSSAATQVLSSNNLTVAPIAPATASGSTFTFPVARGHINKQYRGVIVDKGGFTISNGTRTVRLRNLTVTSTKAGVSIYALTPIASRQSCVRVRRHRVRCVTVTRFRVERIAKVTKVSVSNGTGTGTVDLTAVSAKVINALAGKTVVAAGDPIGTATTTPTVG